MAKRRGICQVDRPEFLPGYRFEAFQNFRAIVPNHYKIESSKNVGPVAQRLEQRTHNPLVPGSNPGGPTSFFPRVNSLFCTTSEVFQAAIPNSFFVNTARK